MNGDGNGPVERKVTVASVTAFVVATVMGYLLLKWPSMPDNLSKPLAALVGGAVTSVLTGTLAWVAKHTNRNDEKAKQGLNKLTH